MAVDKRTLLLDAAEAVLVQQGLVGATIDQITSRAGVAKGTFYLYFRSKDEVIGALQERLWDGMVAASLEAAARMEGDDWWDVIDSFLEIVVDYDMGHRDWHRLVAQGWSSPGSDVAQRERQIVEVIADRIKVGLDKGLFEVPDVGLTATLLYRACSGTMHEYCVSDAPIDRDEVLSAMKWFVRRVLQPPP